MKFTVFIVSPFDTVNIYCTSFWFHQSNYNIWNDHQLWQPAMATAMYRHKQIHKTVYVLTDNISSIKKPHKLLSIATEIKK